MRISDWSSDVCSSDLVFAPDLISGKQSKGVSGRYGAEDALTQLLVGTGLTWERVNGPTIATKRASAPAAEPRAKATSAPAAAHPHQPTAQASAKITAPGTRIRACSQPSPVPTHHPAATP